LKLAAALLLGCALGAASAQEPAARPIDLKFREVEVRDAFRIIARLAGRNLLLAPEVKGKVTMDLTGVDPLKAIDLIAAVNRYEVLVKDGVTVVGDPATMAHVRGAGAMQIIPLRYGNAAELAEKLSKLFKGKLEILADPRTNSLLISRPGAGK
jgi:type IV pilus assembly protein PilQ